MIPDAIARDRDPLRHRRGDRRRRRGLGRDGCRFAEAEPLPDHIEDRLAEFTELVATAISNTEARKELAASRARIVAATDDERRRVVRDLHDGAQQRLVHTIITLKLARRALRDEEEDLAALLSEALGHAEKATAELRELAHGILPEALTRGGLRAGVDALASRMPVPVDIAWRLAGSPPRSKRPPTSSSPRRSPTSPNTLVPDTPRSRRTSRTARCASRCATTASDAPGPTAAVSSAWRTGSPSSTGAPGREPARRRHARRRSHPASRLIHVVRRDCCSFVSRVRGIRLDIERESGLIDNCECNDYPDSRLRC